MANTTPVVRHRAWTAQLDTLVKIRVASQESVTQELDLQMQKWNVLAQMMVVKSYLSSHPLKVHAILDITASKEARKMLTCANPVLVGTVARLLTLYQLSVLLDMQKALKLTPMDALYVMLIICAQLLMQSNTRVLMATILPHQQTMVVPTIQLQERLVAAR
jgi:hypothetical protein